MINIDRHGFGITSHPLTPDEVSLREALTRFGVSRLSSVEVRPFLTRFFSSPSLTVSPPQGLVTPLGISQTKRLTLEQSKLAFLLRFFHRSYRYNNLLHAITGHSIEGHVPQTANTFLAQIVCPFLVSGPDGVPAFRLPPGENEVLVYLREYFEMNLMYTTLSLVGGGYSTNQDHGLLTPAEKRQYDALMPLHNLSVPRLDAEWNKLVRGKRMHPIIMVAARGQYYTRGVFGMEPTDHDRMGPSFCLERSNGLVV